MECWVVLSLHVLLQFVHSITGATLGDVGIPPSLVIHAHTPTPRSGHPTVTPTHATLRWVPPAPPDYPRRPEGGGGRLGAPPRAPSEDTQGSYASRVRGAASKSGTRTETHIKNTDTLLRQPREARETHVTRRAPLVVFSHTQGSHPAPNSSVLQATPTFPVTPPTPRPLGPMSPTSWVPGTPVTQAREAIAPSSPSMMASTLGTILTRSRLTTSHELRPWEMLTSVTPEVSVTPSAGSLSDGVTRATPLITRHSGTNTSSTAAARTTIRDSSGPPRVPLRAGGATSKWSVDGGGQVASSTRLHNTTRTIPRPLAPVVTSRTVNSQLARIWSAGEGEQWVAGSHTMGQGDGPPWSWMKGRRRRRKLLRDGASVLTPPPSLPVTTTPKLAPTKNSEFGTTAEATTTEFSSGHLSRSSTETSAVHTSDRSQLQGMQAVANDRQQGDIRQDGKITMNITHDIPADYDLLSDSLPGGVNVAARQRKGPIDFRITKTGDFGGFSVTKTEEVDPISGFSVTKHEGPDPVVEFGPVEDQLRQDHPGQVIVANKSGSEKEGVASKQEQLLNTPGQTPETPLTARGRLEESRGQDAARVTAAGEASQYRVSSQLGPRPSHTSHDAFAPSVTPSTPVGDAQEKYVTHQSSKLQPNVNQTDKTTSSKMPNSVFSDDSHHLSPEDTYSQELSQMKLMTRPTKVFPVTFEDAGSASPAGQGQEGSPATTLSSIFSEDLIPPLPNQWGTSWKSRGLQRTATHNNPGKETPQDGSPPFEMDSDPAVFPFHLPSQIVKSGEEGGRVGGPGGGSEATSTTGNMRYVGGDDSWRGESQPLVQQGATQPALRDGPGAAAAPPTVDDKRLVKNERTAAGGGGQVVEVRHALGKADLRGSSWPGPGERVEFVTVVPGGHWDVWGGPPLWDSLASRGTNHTIRSPQVYSVYWGDTGGPGSPAGWPEGVWVIRGGSLAAIMALVVTISVQVARDGPAHRATPTADALYRAHHSQHATLATNLATSLASAHILLIFGIQATGKAWVCGVVGLLLHFLHLVSCCWLLALTVRLLGSLLHRRPLHTALYCTASWGASLGLVVVSYVVNPDGYETRRYCWMSVERGMLVSFIVPVCTLILVNAGVCVAAQKVLLDMREGVKHEVMTRHKRDLRGAVSLLPLEGVSWFLAVVALEDHQSLALDCAAALVSASLGWLVLYFHGWTWSCHGLCWLRRRMASRRIDDLSLPLTARYDHDLAHQPLLQPHPHPPTPTPNTVTVAPPPPTTPPQPTHPEEFPLQPIFPHHERREAY